MAYIKRTLEKKIKEISKEYACVLVTGPRQVGKSTMLQHLMEGSSRNRVTLDNTDERKLAKTDPALFLEIHPAPVLIDEVQYAPELFSYIKIKVDDGAAPGSYWLTGSQTFRLMDLARESLAGRTAIVHMSALSQSEHGNVRTHLARRDAGTPQRKIYRSGCVLQFLYSNVYRPRRDRYDPGRG